MYSGQTLLSYRIPTIPRGSYKGFFQREGQMNHAPPCFVVLTVKVLMGIWGSLWIHFCNVHSYQTEVKGDIETSQLQYDMVNNYALVLEKQEGVELQNGCLHQLRGTRPTERLPCRVPKALLTCNFSCYSLWFLGTHEHHQGGEKHSLTKDFKL